MKLKAWLTVPEAACHLALVFGEDVTEADILRFGLDGHLKLSVRFGHGVTAVRYRERTDAERREFKEDFDRRLAAAKAAGVPFQKRVLTPEQEKQREEEEEKIVFLGEETYDLPLVGGERIDVRNQHRVLTGGQEEHLISLDGTFVETEDGIRLQIQDHLETEAPMTLKERYAYSNCFPAAGLPDNSVLVVRTTALHEFETRVLVDSTEPSSDAPDLDKLLQERERGTLLTIIGALAKFATIDISKPSKAAHIVEKLVQEVGAEVSARAIENHLKRVPDALERRGKTSV